MISGKVFQRCVLRKGMFIGIELLAVVLRFVLQLIVLYKFDMLRKITLTA